MKRLLAFLALHLCMKVLLAQPGALDLSFDPGSGANAEIQAIAVQPDGKLLIGGFFTSYAGQPADKIARLLPLGGFDSTFHAGFSDPVRILALQPDGKVIVGGDFSRCNGDSVFGIARLHPDGTRDTTFNSKAGFNDRVYSLSIQPDGKVICGGLFTQYNGSTCNRLVRLHPNGDLDTTFNTQTGATQSVEVIKIQPDGKILIAGDFTSYDGDYCFRIARVHIDGSRDSSFTALPGASAVIFDMALQPDGKIVIGGNMSQYDFQPRSKLARVLPNGGLDPQFGVSPGANSSIASVVLIPGSGEVLIGGGFTTYQNQTIPYIAKLYSNSTPDTTFNRFGTGPDQPVGPMLRLSNGKIIATGLFNTYNGTPRGRIARLYNCLTPQPDSIYGSSYARCSGTLQTYSIAPVNGATKYEWTLPNGWSGSSDSTSIIATGNGAGGSITVKAFTDSCGWSYTTTRAIATIQPPGVDICLVTVDSASTHNIILWEKPETTIIDSFFIYRETSSNVYTKVGAVGYQDLSEFHDDTTANPNSTSYRYKLSVLDTCGAESELSPFHRTIHLQNLGNGNFQWTFYQIQGQSNPVVSFNINRDNLGNGNFFPIGNVPGTNATFTDITFNSFSNSEYVVDVDWSISCTPTRQVNTTRSNIRKKTMIDFPLAVEEAAASNITLNVYPNPATETILLQFSDGSRPTAAYVLNALGEKVAALQSATHTLDVSSLAAGIYLLYAESAAGVFKTRVCVY